MQTDKSLTANYFALRTFPVFFGRLPHLREAPGALYNLTAWCLCHHAVDFPVAPWREMQQVILDIFLPD